MSDIYIHNKLSKFDNENIFRKQLDLIGILKFDFILRSYQNYLSNP